MIDVFPPAGWLLLGGALIALTRSHLRTAVVLVTPLVTLWAAWQVPDGVAMTVPFLDYLLEPIEGSPVRRLFATIFAIMAFAGGLFGFRQASARELAAGYIYAAGAIGVCFAGDLITLFLYWELMALFSTVVIWCGGTPAARAAGIRYAVLHLLGGIILKVGIEGVVVNTVSIDVRPMFAHNFETWMILIGILINAAAPPLSAWIADAYPEASPTGSVFLSAFTTKTAVLALILLFPGEQVLIWIGLYMIMYGILCALLENDARRILAYSIVNQVGFMVCAVGIGTEMALNGAAAHAFSHIIYKALLFMSAGVVLYRTGKRKCTELGGLFRTMPLTTLCCIIAALSISGFPLTSGFTTKTLISQAAGMEGLMVVYLLLAAASAGVFLHAGIKFPWFVFFQKDSGLRPEEAPWNMSAGMVLFAVLCILLGVYPELLYQHLPYPVTYEPYTAGKVVFYLQLLLFSGLAFFLFLPLMRRTETLSLDVDWLWRAGLPRAMLATESTLLKLRRFTRNGLDTGKRWARKVARLLFASEPSEQGNGYFLRSSSIGTTALLIATLLSAYVLVYFL